MTTYTWALLWGGLLSCAAASAQDTTRTTKQIEEVTIRNRVKSTEINLLGAIKTEKIGARELLKAACCNLSESFETTPSVDVAFTDAVSGYKQIQMLGLTGAYTYFTRENIPDIRGLASITGLSYTPGTWIEGMQLSKGTGSVVNGFESVAGQINVEWKKPFEDKEPTALVNLYQSTQARTEANLVFRNQFSGNLSTNLLLHGRSNWARIDQNNDGFMDQPLDKQFVGANRWFWHNDKGLEIQGGIKGVYTTNTGGQLNYNRDVPQVTGNPWGYQSDVQRLEGWAKIGKVFARNPGSSMGLQLAGTYHNQESQFGARRYEGRQQSFYANLIYQTLLGTTDHVLKAGASLQHDQYDETLSGNPYGRTESVPGVFTEYSYNGNDKWNVVAGLRADYHNLYGAFVTPRLHVRYTPWEKASLRASVGRAQRTANIFAENMGFMASNRSFVIDRPETGMAYGLKPEVAWNTGLNFTQKFRLNYRDGSFSTDYYYTDFQNQIVVDIEDPTQVRFYNLDGRSFAHSLQAQFDYELIRNLDLRLAYRWYDVRTTYDGVEKERPLVAAHRAFANVGYETRNHWKLDYTVQLIGPKRIPATYSHHGGGTEGESYSPAFVQMSAQISKSWKNDDVEVYLGGENLTNYMQHPMILGSEHPFSTGFDASLIWGPAMGRNLYAGLRWKIQ
ncbi:MAG: TonB-dependent receptor [Sphingobacteriales bacterium]|nr:MAG: TonB-dependent receptor [Sphingobacteriales bacterium]